MTHVLHIITGLGDGGAEGVLTRLVQNDRQHRHSVISLSTLGKHGPKLGELGISVRALGLPRGRITPGAVATLYRWVRASDATVVQTWMYHADLLGGVVARAAGKSQVAWGIRNAYLDAATVSRSARLSAWVCARLSSFVPARIVSCSLRALDTHQAIGYRADRMVVIPNGYDVARIAPDPRAGDTVRRELGVAPGTPLLGMVARWDPQKDHANLLGALALLAGDTSGWRCVLAGTGMVSTNADLVGLIRHHGLEERVTLLGPRADVPDLMNALDLHVLSSAGEAFPNVVAEAMACGTVCVVTDVGDAAAIVGDTGWVVPPRDSSALAEALRLAIQSLKDPQAASAMSKAARDRIVTEFSLDRMVDTFGRLWADMARESE